MFVEAQAEARDPEIPGASFPSLLSQLSPDAFGGTQLATCKATLRTRAPLMKEVELDTDTLSPSLSGLRMGKSGREG